MGIGLEQTLFLSPTVWERYGLANMNVDEKRIRPLIYSVQRNRIEPVIGSILYRKLIDDIDGSSLSGLYKTLVDEHILPTMISYCDWKYTIHSTSQLTNKTTGRNNDEHISSNSVADNNNVRDEILSDAKLYEKKMIQFLCDNYDNIPELSEVDADTIHQDIRPQTKPDNDYKGKISIV